MSELDAFLGREDQRELANIFTAEGAVLVPDRDYETPEYHEIASMEEFDRARSTGASIFYVLSDSFERSPLEMRFTEEKRRYFIMPRNGGPTIEFSCGAVFVEKGVQHVAQSFIAHYPTYWNTLSKKNEKPPEALLALYKKAARQLKAAGHKIKTKNRTYCVGKEAERLRREGAKFVGVDL